MRIIDNLDEMTETARGWLTGGAVGFVSIMSDLHEGHRTLIQAAREACEISVVSILENSLQLDASEAGAQPRDLLHDLHLLGSIGVDIVFTPRIEDMYPPDFAIYVTPIGPLEQRLRQIRGISVRRFATTMMKLFQLIRPDIAYFGLKDACKVAVIRQLVRDLNIDVNLSMLPTAREKNGLAISSRNAKLSPTERQAASVLYRALLAGKALIEQGERRPFMIERAITELVATVPAVTLEYVMICQCDTLAEVQVIVPGTLLSVGAQVGGIQLADNIMWTSDGLWSV